MSSTPASGVRPCGVPSSTRSAPASHSSITRSATSRGVPAMQKRSSRGSSPSSSVGSCCATMSRYGWTTDAACACAHSPSSSTTVTQPVTRRTSGLPIHARTSGRSSGFAVPPTFTSSATVPAHAAVSRPHVPMRSGTESRSRGYASAAPGASVKRSPCTPRFAGEQRPDDRLRLLQRGKRPRLLEPEAVEPGALRQAEVRTPARDGVEHRDLTGDLVRMERERIERRRPSRTRSVTRAMSSSGPIAGWYRRSWKTERTSTPASSARRAIAS